MPAKRPPGRKMDPWKFYAITHADHTIMNPLSQAKLDRLTGCMPRGSHVSWLDMGCGKGQLLIDLAAKGSIGIGAGIDVSPFEVDNAKRALAGWDSLPVTFHLIDGAKFRPPAGHRYDATVCLGATWILGGYRNTLKTLSGWTRPAGGILVGHTFWRRPPPASYLRAESMKRSENTTHAGNIKVAERLGLELLSFAESSAGDFDVYEGRQWNAARHWADRNPDDPDVEEVLARVRRSREAYLRWGRGGLGWAAYAFRNRGRAPLAGTPR